MDIIGQLERTVTPAVLGDNSNPQNESLLRQFYALFSAKLADKATYARFDGKEITGDDNSFYDRVWLDDNHRSSIARELAASNNVDHASVNGLVAAAAPLAYNEIRNLAGSTPVPQFLRDNLSTYRDHIPSWASTVIPAGILVVEDEKPVGQRISDTTSTAPLHREEKEEGSFWKALLPIIGLIILAALAWALLKGCQEEPKVIDAPAAVVESREGATPATTTPMASVEPAVLALATGQGNQLFACRVSVGDSALGDTITTAMNNVFGDEANKCRVETDNNFATDMPAAPYLSDILPILKSSPDVNAIIEGNRILVNSPDDAELNRVVEALRAVAPDMDVIAEEPLDLQGEIDRSILEANTALDALGENPDPLDVARALGLQVINFEFDESFIPEVNKPVLDRAVELMTQVPDMDLLIIGHTDAIGSNAYNIPLSQRRAQAVKDYMVSKGADASRLFTRGMGESDPIASNETPQGRFRNRRIEYVVYDLEMGPADAQGIVVAPDAELQEIDVTNLPDADRLAPEDRRTVESMTSAVGNAAGNAVDGAENAIGKVGNVAGNAIDEAGTAIGNVGNAVGDALPDPDLNPLDSDNDDILPDSDDVLLNKDNAL